MTAAATSGPVGEPPPPLVNGRWTMPPLELLERPEPVKVDEGRLADQGATLVAALAAHKVETQLSGIVPGPAVTRFELELGAGVRVSKLNLLRQDIAYALAATDVRLLGPIPGRSLVGVEVPSTARQLVTLRGVLERSWPDSPLEVPAGVDVEGAPVTVDLAAMPHLLVAGATGSGKSAFLTGLLAGLLARQSPDDARLVLIDPKGVELVRFDGAPHLLCPTITAPEPAVYALAWCVAEMGRRYRLLAAGKVRDLAGWNELDVPQLPPVVVVVDELADLMMQAREYVEYAVMRLAQKARAVGIHLVLATQRPSVDVVTGVIKGNVPSRVAFATASAVDSRVILDESGAERLIGRGDGLLKPVSSPAAVRFQAAWASDRDVSRLVGWWGPQGAADDVGSPAEAIAAGTASPGFEAAPRVRAG